MLFTGDSGISTFEKLKGDLPTSVTVLKVGHHGANGVVNRNMLDYLKPETAVISVGTNKFGHPSVRTLEMLKGINTLRTDVNNSVRFVVNDKGYETFVFDSKKKKYLAY